jgi:ABC-type polysaccharide/polyol phosphate transport system ATPase subunit
MHMPIDFNQKLNTQGSVGNRYLAIRLDDVFVYYPHVKNRPNSLKEFVIRWTRRDIEREFLKAIDGVNFEVRAGEIFGIIGRNGAGKTTLLKVISGILRPSQGRVRVWGRISTLLGVGAGFHPELTGKENIYLYSALLGRSRSVTNDLLEETIAFAELSDFIDAPLRTYSSGMIARLGFSVAMAERPDILLVDEVLGVGDEQFRIKCQNTFQHFQDAGTTIVLVTHQLNVVRETCTRAAWMNNGRFERLGDPSEVVQQYLEFQT